MATGWFDDFLSTLLSDPNQPGGTGLMHFLGVGSPTASTQTPTVVPTGTAPTVVPSSGSRPPLTLGSPMLGGAPPPVAASGGLLGGQGLLSGIIPHGGLLGNSLLGKMLGGAMSGLGSVQPGQTGLGAFGAGFQGATTAAEERRQQQLKDQYLNYQMTQETQKTTDAATKKQYLETLIASLPKEQQDAARADPDTFLAQYTKAQFAGGEPPKTSGGMQYNTQTKAWEPIPGYTEQARAIAEAGRSPGGGHTTITMDKPPPTMEERDRAILLHGDPSTPEYAAAWDNFKKPTFHQNPDNTWSQVTPPDPPWARPPTYVLSGATGGGGAPVTGDGTTTAPPPAAGGTTAAPPTPAPATGGTPATPAGPTVTTTGTPKPEKPTVDEAKARQLYAEALPQVPIVMKNFDEASKLTNQLAGYVPIVGNYLQSAEYQQLKYAAARIISAWLYTTSGATIGDKEMQRKVEQSIPLPGDKPPAIADKLAEMQMMVDVIRIRGGLPAPAAGGQGGDTHWIYKDGKLVPEGTP